MPDAVDTSRTAVTARTAGYCFFCDRLVERLPDGGCAHGHPAAAVSGDIELAPGEPVPSLPRFNFAAFALPPVWGIAHGQWAGVFFLPIWLFADNALSVASRNTLTLVMAAVVLVGTLAFQTIFAKRANGVAWRAMSGRITVNDFVARQRRWTMWCAPLGAGLLGWALYFRFVVA